jgi:DNA ligase 1
MKTYDVINKLAKTPSTNEKKKILENLTGQLRDDVKFIFLWTYSPKLNYFIKKIDPNKIIETANPYLDFDEEINKDSENEILELLQDLSERLVTGNAALDRVHKTLGLFNEESRELIVKILLRDLRCGVTDTIANKIWPDWIPVFDVQLANTFDPEKPREKTYWVSRKMDGLRGIYIPHEGLYTRQGKKIVGFENTIEKDLFEFSVMNGGCSVDGELFSTAIPFEEIQGAVMSNKNIDDSVKEAIIFNAFAVVKDFWGKKIFEDTWEMIDIVNSIGNKYKYLKPVETIEVSVSEIDSIHDKFVLEGYEGIMLRHPKISYEFKRGNGLLKFKKFFEADFEIVDVFEGKGKYQGKLGGIKVRGEIDGKVIESEVGSGFNDEQRDEMWKNELIIGRKVEVKYQGITPDNSLRFPVFNKLKLDR